MISAKQVKYQILVELQALLNTYNAELYAEDHYEGYAECGEDVRMTIYVPAVYDADNNCIREATEVDLGDCVLPMKLPPLNT